MATDARSRKHETGWIDRLVPILEQVAGGTPRPEADGNRTSRHQDAAGRHIHPRKGYARRSGLPSCRHAALRQLRPRTQGVRLRFAVAGEGPAHDRAAGAQRFCVQIRGGRLAITASAATSGPTNSNWCCCRSTAASRIRAAWAPRRLANGRSGWAPTRSSKRRSIRCASSMRTASRYSWATARRSPCRRWLRRNRRSPRSGGGRRIRHLVVLEGGREE